VELLVLFAWSFAAATVLPLASELPLSVVVHDSGTWLVPVLVATAGNTLGACTTYWLGRATLMAVQPSSARVERASSLLRRYGAPAMLLSWVPLIGDVLVVLAGAAKMPFAIFVTWAVIGKLARYLAVAMAIRSI
jgi:membrane protein YqaA with SNARE-associated domain